MRFSVARHVLAATFPVLAMGSASAAELTVSAAASLANAFKEIIRNYEGSHPDARVVLNQGASGTLLQQMVRGAPVDVFASADQETMDQAEEQGLIATGSRQDFASNSLVLIVPADSRLELSHIRDLEQGSVQKIAMGNPASVPVGRYARQALNASGLWQALEARFVLTQNVRQSLDYVARGEVEAGFVYATDAALMRDRVKVAFTVLLDVAIRYPVAQTAGSTNAEEARRFIGYVRSPEGQTVLETFGFRKP